VVVDPVKALAGWPLADEAFDISKEDGRVAPWLAYLDATAAALGAVIALADSRIYESVRREPSTTGHGPIPKSRP
jgi:hypothetical protein